MRISEKQIMQLIVIASNVASHKLFEDDASELVEELINDIIDQQSEVKQELE